MRAPAALLDNRLSLPLTYQREKRLSFFLVFVSVCALWCRPPASWVSLAVPGPTISLRSSLNRLAVKCGSDGEGKGSPLLWLGLGAARKDKDESGSPHDPLREDVWDVTETVTETVEARRRLANRARMRDAMSGAMSKAGGGGRGPASAMQRRGKGPF